MHDDPETEDDDSLPLRELHRIAGGTCADCHENFSAREAVFSIALGFKDAPRCLNCLTKRLDREPLELRTQLLRYIHGRECYLKAWREAEKRDGQTELADPRPANANQPAPPEADKLNATETWNAGDMGCGELVMALRLRLNHLPTGGVICVTATDPAAPEDLPAWCRLTGHKLLQAEHPNYFIQRKEH